MYPLPGCWSFRNIYSVYIYTYVLLWELRFSGVDEKFGLKRKSSSEMLVYCWIVER